MLEKTRSRSRVKREQKCFPVHLKNIRQCACLVCGAWPSESAHVRFSSAKYGKVNSGVGSKPSDKFTVPLCASCHREGPDAQHSSGEQSWWARKEIDPLDIAQRLWAAREDLEQMQKIAGAIR
jgi:hypothetical protein